MCISPMSIPRVNGTGAADRITVPCGKCSFCRKRRRDDWTIRLTEEMKDHHDAIFLTLTYNDENLIYADELPTLYKPDIQNFLKRLRKRLNFNIRYYAVGEYGGQTIRPHYHLIIFGLSKLHENIIKLAWSNYNKKTKQYSPIGSIYIGTVGIRSIKYVTKYHVNRNEHPDGVEKEFTLMSTRPAIGANYVEKMVNYHSGNITKNYYTLYERKLHLPRYYQEKLYTDADREAMAEIYASTDYNKEDKEAWEKKNPKGNYYKYLSDKIANHEKQFKNKKRRNETI